MEGVQPAQLSFLTIYNPLLGTTEDTSHDQIVYHYSSRSGRVRKAREAAGLSEEEKQNEERNERMRQVGLAQGVVNFARDFSNGESVDYIDTGKSRIFIHELEPDWWLLASIDLTRFETTLNSEKSGSSRDKPETKVEYSSRELSPQPLLLQQALRAHGIFLLHHGASLSDIMARRGRLKLTGFLERFWNRFVRHWDVLMHASPAVDIFNGLKLAAGGELGMGVGEEEWGSGERDVLEDMIARTDGLVDMMISRFGEPPSQKVQDYEEVPPPWLGTGAFPKPSDGVVFSGIGNTPRIDVLRISAWVEWIYRFGVSAYGVQDNPQSRRRRPRPKPAAVEETDKESTKSKDAPPPAQRTPVKGIPPPLLTGNPAAAPTKQGDDPDQTEETQSLMDTETVIKYMTLGIYGSSWGIPSGRPSPARSPDRGSTPTKNTKSAQGDASRGSSKAAQKLADEEKAKKDARAHPDIVRGCFLIGLKGDLSQELDTEAGSGAEEVAAILDGGASSEGSAVPSNMAARRIQLRTLHVTQSSLTSMPIPPPSSRLRVVVYARQPFIYTLLFDVNSQPGLAFTSFYRNLHNQFLPLQKPLLKSTSPADVRRRLLEAAGSPTTQDAMTHPVAPVWDLVYDPANGTCHTSLPSIPDMSESLGLPSPARRQKPGASPASSKIERPMPPQWTRSDALAIHNLIVSVWQDTRRRPSEVERTMRTSRGWLVVWMRLPANREVLDAINKDKNEEEQTVASAMSSSVAVASTSASINTQKSGEAKTDRQQEQHDAGDHPNPLELDQPGPSAAKDDSSGKDKDDAKSHVSDTTITGSIGAGKAPQLVADDDQLKSQSQSQFQAQYQPTTTSTQPEQSRAYIPAEPPTPQPIGMQREAFLVRRALDSKAARDASRSLGRSGGAGAGARSGSGSSRSSFWTLGLGGGGGGGGGFGGFGFGSGAGEDDGSVTAGAAGRDGAGGGGGAGGAGGSAVGMGIDTRRYIEGLLSLNR